MYLLNTFLAICLSPCPYITDCLTPPNLDHGTLVYTTTLFEGVANVTCDVGYTANVNVIECTHRRTWSDIPRCIPVGRLFGCEQRL